MKEREGKTAGPTQQLKDIQYSIRSFIPSEVLKKQFIGDYLLGFIFKLTAILSRQQLFNFFSF